MTEDMTEDMTEQIVRHVVAEPDAAVEVLSSPLVTPPPRDGAGSTLGLRRDMARFSRPGAHAPRRTELDELVVTVDDATTAALASRLTARQLKRRGGTAFDLGLVARTVPVTAISIALGLLDEHDEADAAALVHDVELVAAVVGRGAEATCESDAATDRVLTRATDHRLPPVAAASILHQTLDATATLIGVSLLTRASGEPPAPVAPRTFRTAIADGQLGDIDLRAGDEVTVELAAAGLPYGAGPHVCPGRALAESIAAAVIAAIYDAGYDVDPDRVAVDGDGRPTSLWLTTPARPRST
jgi:cytochrome P450